MSYLGTWQQYLCISKRDTVDLHQNIDIDLSISFSLGNWISVTFPGTCSNNTRSIITPLSHRLFQLFLCKSHNFWFRAFITSQLLAKIPHSKKTAAGVNSGTNNLQEMDYLVQKKTVTPLLTHWGYIFLALTYRYGHSIKVVQCYLLIKQSNFSKIFTKIACTTIPAQWNYYQSLHCVHKYLDCQIHGIYTLQCLTLCIESNQEIWDKTRCILND